MRQKPVRPLPPKIYWPWDPIELEASEVAMIKNMAVGHPQAFTIVLEKICRVDSMSFTIGGEDGRRASDFAEGKTWIGRTLRGIANRIVAPKARGPEPGFSEIKKPAAEVAAATKT